MSAFELDLDPKSSAGADSIDLVNRRVLAALRTRLRERKITQKELAAKLGIDKSTISRLLRGNQNITARTLGELFWALDFAYDISLLDLDVQHANTLPDSNSSRNTFSASGISNSVGYTTPGTDYRVEA
ncbi:helix-turn-helix domain-containing protein [Cognatishimia sp.]|uniref:helix-turn-helix domain-containing protein n=1 Tax=Cognatishimia sp. TaxID=2211648 RepID=UPI0035163D8A|nr:helix-turn-helix transcriptional regulator [Cognatishimia sp.]